MGCGWFRAPICAKKWCRGHDSFVLHARSNAPRCQLSRISVGVGAGTGHEVSVRVRSRRRARRRSVRLPPCPRSTACVHVTRRARMPHRKEVPVVQGRGSTKKHEPGAGASLGLICGRTHELPHTNLVRSRLNLRGHDYFAHELFEVVVPARLDVGSQHVTRGAYRRHRLLLQRLNLHDAASSSGTQCRWPCAQPRADEAVLRIRSHRPCTKVRAMPHDSNLASCRCGKSSTWLAPAMNRGGRRKVGDTPGDSPASRVRPGFRRRSGY